MNNHPNSPTAPPPNEKPPIERGVDRSPESSEAGSSSIAGSSSYARSLPTGTVTFLFTDIVGSTPLWESHPEEMAQALQIHNAALRQAIQANGGMVFKTVGDAFQAAFPTALDGLKAAIQGQRALQAAAWNELGELKVRMGLHTGEAALDPGGDEYAVSHSKNRIGRIHSIAAGGQILISAETFELVNHQLPEGVTLKDLGEHRLKGMQWLEHLYQACAPGLPQDFPPLVTALTRLNNLPVQLTSFIGRQLEQAEVAEMIQQHRLVTLIGPGGTGKTRLSLAVASGLVDEFEHGTWLVELAPLNDPALIPSSVASLFGLRAEAGRSLQTALEDFLCGKRLLLVLDNCEHLIQPAAQFTFAILRAAPQVKILASSREALGLPGEAVYPVPSLNSPEPRHLPPLDELAAFDAVRLFVERARAASPAFTLNEANAPAVAQICRRLDGIPLALELAAARLKVLSAEHIAARLDDRFRLLTGGSRAALPRHQTLHALIDWSYELLGEAERRLFRRLSVFRDGWRLEAVEVVCAESDLGYPAALSTPAAFSTGGSDEFYDVLEALAELVNKSLVAVELQDGEVQRYHMLETMRQYAQEKLLEAREAERMRDQHLAYYAAFAEGMEKKLHTPAYLEALTRWVEELDNFRAALDWALGRDISAITEASLGLGLRLAAAMAEFMYIQGLHAEWFDWVGVIQEIPEKTAALEELRARAYLNARYYWFIADAIVQKLVQASLTILRQHGSHPDLGLALVTYGGLLYGVGSFSPRPLDSTAGMAFVEEGVAMLEASGDPVSLGWAWYTRGMYLHEQKNFKAMHNAMEKSITCFEQAGDLVNAYTVKHLLGDNAFTYSAYTIARKLYEQCQSFYQLIDSKFALAYLNAKLGQVNYCQDDFTQAEVRFQQALALAEEMGIQVGAVWMSRVLACIALRQGQPGTSRQRFLESLEKGRKLLLGEKPGDPYGDLAFVLWMGSLAQAEGLLERSARYLGAVEVALKTFFKPLDKFPEQMEYDRVKGELRANLSPADLKSARADGRKLTLEAALQEALTYCREGKKAI